MDHVISYPFPLHVWIDPCTFCISSSFAFSFGKPKLLLLLLVIEWSVCTFRRNMRDKQSMSWLLCTHSFSIWRVNAMRHAKIWCVYVYCTFSGLTLLWNAIWHLSIIGFSLQMKTHEFTLKKYINSSSGMVLWSISNGLTSSVWFLFAFCKRLQEEIIVKFVLVCVCFTSFCPDQRI